MIVVVAPGQGSQSPGFLEPWLEDGAQRDFLESLSDSAGMDLVAHGTTSDADTIRDTKIAQPLLVATGLVAALDLFPHPADAFARIGAVAGHSVGELTAASGARVITAEQAMVLVRERGKAMADEYPRLTLFGEAFEDPASYGDARPDAGYFGLLLADPTFVALVAREGDRIVGGLAAYELRKFEQACVRWCRVSSTEVATLRGMAMDSRFRVRRTRAPRVEEAERTRAVARSRLRREIRRARLGGEGGTPRREVSWEAKVSIAASRSEAVRTWESLLVGLRICTPPHCGIVQLLPPVSRRRGRWSAAGTYRTMFIVGPEPMLGLRGHSAALMKPLRSDCRSL